MSWCRTHFVDVYPDIASFSTDWVWNLLSCLWGAFSDEKPGLSFVSHSLVICLYVHLPFKFLCFTLLSYVLYHTYNIHKASFSSGSVQQNIPYCSLVAHAITAILVYLEVRGYFTTDSQSVCLGFEHPFLHYVTRMYIFINRIFMIYFNIILTSI
jgi:hypothetical protein